MIETIVFKTAFLELNKLGSIPQSVFWAAIDGLLEKTYSAEKKAFLRRLALIALCGGVSVDLLDCLKDFTFQSKHFTSLPLPIGNFALDDGQQCNVEQSKNNFAYLKDQLEGEVKLLEAGIRALFWDTLVIDSFRDPSAPWAVHPELDLEALLKLDSSRWVDIAVFLKKFKNIILFCEISKDKFTRNIYHKDFSKLSSTLTVSCIRLAEFLKSRGCDPSKARTFGMLIGNSCFQLAVARPVFTPIPGTRKHEIHVDVSVNPHWFCDFDDPENFSLSCSGPCCMQDDLNPLPKAENIPIPNYLPTEESKKFLAQSNLIPEESNFDNDDKDEGGEEVSAIDEEDNDTSATAEEDIDEERKEPMRDYVEEVLSADTDVAMSENVSTTSELLIERRGINEKALSKYSIFVKTVKKYMTDLMSFEKVDASSIPDFEPPNLAYIPIASRGNEKETPRKHQIWAVFPTNEKADSSPLNNSKLNYKSQSESDFYSKYLNSYICFPTIQTSWKNDNGTVAIRFERMHHLVGNGIFGPYGNGELFGPMIRSESPLELIVDACTFAIHSLYGLHVLHDMVGYVHADISPENIMFSFKDEIWKLNDFETALPIEKSLQTVRQCGTENFIAPESLKTGIFTTSSDLYSLGSILWKIFHIQIMWLTCLDEQAENVQRAYDDFFQNVVAMIQESPADRPSVMKSMTSFFNIIKRNQIKGFKVYGSDTLMVKIEKLIEQYESEESGSPQIELQEIVAENVM